MVRYDKLYGTTNQRKSRVNTDALSIVVELLPLAPSLALNCKVVMSLEGTSTKDALDTFTTEKEVLSRRAANPEVGSLASEFTHLMKEYKSKAGGGGLKNSKCQTRIRR